LPGPCGTCCRPRSPGRIADSHAPASRSGSVGEPAGGRPGSGSQPAPRGGVGPSVSVVGNSRCRIGVASPSPRCPGGTMPADTFAKGCAACDEWSRSPTARVGWVRPR
jgi:hypothetical protein